MSAAGGEGGMKYGSVCSGIGAATVAWRSMGWKPAFFSEIDAFPRAVLTHHYPDVPLHGDFTTIQDGDYDPIDLLVGGTPCQSFSVAGLRKGLYDPRGNLMLEYGSLAQRLRPTWLVWENVPGVLSANRGRDFGAFLGMLAELGYGFAYRVLDAQYFGVAQRRRRVFVVGYLGDWRPAAAVLFERHSLSGHPAPSREAWASVAALPANGVGTRGADDNQGKIGQLIPVVLQHCHVVHGTQDPCHSDTTAFALGRNSGRENVVCVTGTVTHALNTANNGKGSSEDGTGRGVPIVNVGSMVVRRLTPVECERLQGFPDDYTRIPYRNKSAENCPDGPRYKALGNSMAVPVMHWIGDRIARVMRCVDRAKSEAA